MQLLNACGRDGCGICRKEEEKENVLSYSTVLLYFFFFIKNMIAFKIEVVFMCKAVLDFGWCRKHACIVTFQYKKKNKKKKQNLIKEVQGFFSFRF